MKAADLTIAGNIRGVGVYLFTLKDRSSGCSTLPQTTATCKFVVCSYSLWFTSTPAGNVIAGAL